MPPLDRICVKCGNRTSRRWLALHGKTCSRCYRAANPARAEREGMTYGTKKKRR